MSTASTPRRSQPITSPANPDNGDDSDIDMDADLPPYEPPIAPLTSKCHEVLGKLLQSNRLKALDEHIKNASYRISEAGGDMNEQFVDARSRYFKTRGKRRGQTSRGVGGDADGDRDGDEEVEDEYEDGGDEEDERFKRTEEQVKAVTARLDEEVRRIIDTEVFVKGLKDSLVEIDKESGQSTSTQRSRPNNRRRNRRNPDPEDEDEEESDEDHSDNDTTQPSEENEQDKKPPSQTLLQKLSTDQSTYSAQSLAQRYSTNNTYIGFKRTIHEAQYSGNDIPPMEHASTWFRHLESPSTTTPGVQADTDNNITGVGRGGSTITRQNSTTTQNQEDDEDDEEDLAIARERISLKCPLTLLPYKDPLTSTKCPHSFEEHAILDMISHSPSTVPAPPLPGTGRNRRVQSVKCPVCSVVLTEGDLRRDPVLVRRVRRMEEVLRREEEDDEDDDDGNEQGERQRKKRKSGITVASDDEDEDEYEEEPVRIKQEQTISRGPSTA